MRTTGTIVNRYAIGDFPGLKHALDGSIEHRSNWLPIPKMPLLMVLRVYIPAPEVIEARHIPPGFEKVR